MTVLYGSNRTRMRTLAALGLATSGRHTSSEWAAARTDSKMHGLANLCYSVRHSNWNPIPYVGPFSSAGPYCVFVRKRGEHLGRGVPREPCQNAGELINSILRRC
ncbi:hypothetical protein DPEC_G00339400 [Dallia pectoralis]|uniref:Uncharacterized protein n=1 Tax=Dallia pectoralis TaxID=75939 RepID=A0ACC2F4W9_DALPE|nr:hypothetical protein DPEC_G00339400 [Dallia pectoralis]